MGRVANSGTLEIRAKPGIAVALHLPEHVRMRVSTSLTVLAVLLAGCGGSDRDRAPGQTQFESAPPAVGGDLAGGGKVDSPGAGSGNGTGAPASSSRTVQETDLYRLEGNRLYYLNAYRGLMVFDVTNPDQPVLIGRSPIFGDPVDMIVRNGVAIVVVGDWFGMMDDGTPFHGSIVRGLDATDPHDIRVLGEAKLGGWVRDDRVVGDVIYAVSEDYGWWYGWDTETAGGGAGVSSAPQGPSVIVSSVSFANGQIAQVDKVQFGAFAGVFNVTPSSIMLASDASGWTTAPPGAPVVYTSKTQLLYLDISDPGGAIVERGALTVDGAVNGWGVDNGRWNLDFADGKTAHVVCQASNYNDGYVLSTVDFTNPGAPVLASALHIPSTGWSAAARFDTDRLYLSPQPGYYNGTSATPLQVYDLTVPAAPRLAGTTQLPGLVWNLLPAPGSRIFALGNGSPVAGEGNPVSVHYLDVTDPAAPRLLGTSTFGQGWAWTPAAGTFKAFTMDAASGLVVVPFAGWDPQGRGYNNGLQLIEFTPSSVTTAGAARTKGWVERGIFVGNRLVSLSSQSLAVVDYSAPMAPRVVSELTLARNVVTAQPSGATIAEVSSDWWGNDTSSSQVRVLPIDNAEETSDAAGVPTVNVDGVGAQVFSNGRYTYIVTSVLPDKTCTGYGCTTRTQQVQVVDLAGGGAVLRGKIQLPTDTWGWYVGWARFWWWGNWWWGNEVVQVGGDVLAFRRWEPQFTGSGAYVDAQTSLYVVDLANPDAPQLASTVVQTDPRAWWGNMQVVGDSLYTTHYDWVEAPDNQHGWVRYYLDSVDLSDRAHPRIGAKVNVPGLLVGGDASDPSVIYTIDYRWNDGTATNDLDVLRIHGPWATLLSQTPINGWVGSTFIVGTQAYLSAQEYRPDGLGIVDLHAIDLSNPSHPRDRIASEHGFGWLLGVAGDRALVTSGWSGGAIDIYRLRAGGAPQFDQTVRANGWGVNSVSRQDQTLFLSSGFWGVQKIALQ
jgi:hypothetical protein